MKIETIIVGPLQVNCYLIYDEHNHAAMIIDPGDEANKIIREVEKRSLNVQYIVCTHAHFDHIGAVSTIREKTGAKIILHKNDLPIYAKAQEQGFAWGFSIKQPPSPDWFILEGDEISIGDMTFKVISTPGHSPGSICLYGHGVIVTGDTVFAGSIGRTDLYGGSLPEIKKSFSRVISFPPDTVILPGHGDSSTVSEEREIDSFIQAL